MDPGIIPKAKECEIADAIEKDPGSAHHPPRQMEVQVCAWCAVAALVCYCCSPACKISAPWRSNQRARKRVAR